MVAAEVGALAEAAPFTLQVQDIHTEEATDIFNKQED